MIRQYFMEASPEYFYTESAIPEKKHIEVKDFVISTEKYNKSNMRETIIEYEIKD